MITANVDAGRPAHGLSTRSIAFDHAGPAHQRPAANALLAERNPVHRRWRFPQVGGDHRVGRLEPRQLNTVDEPVVEIRQSPLDASGDRIGRKWNGEPPSDPHHRRRTDGREEPEPAPATDRTIAESEIARREDGQQEEADATQQRAESYRGPRAHTATEGEQLVHEGRRRAHGRVPAEPRTGPRGSSTTSSTYRSPSRPPIATT